jgi:NAD(P)-dependent dehydrogenase (short-subunit alcohol dehydrogenase family)
MQPNGISAVVTGGASGLGHATVALLGARGARVTFCDLPGSPGEAVARECGARFIAADVTDTAAMAAVFDAAEADGPLRAVVHCAGRGGAVRLVERDGSAGSLEAFESVIKVNLIGSFNVLRLAAARIAKAEPVADERGVCVMTASVAAYEGQIGQMPYSASKAGVVGMTLVAARDLASRLIRVCTIAPGIFDTPMLARLSEDIRLSLGRSVPHPARLGRPEEFAQLAVHIIENPMLNGETIRLDGALRMPPR